MGVRDVLGRWRQPAVAQASHPASAKAVLKRARNVHRLDAAGWESLVAEATSTTLDWSRDQWWELGVRDRVLLSLTAQGNREAVALLDETRTVHGPTFKIDRDLRRIDLHLADGGVPMEIPGWLLVGQPQDFVARAMVEVAGSSPCVVAGTSFISGLPFRAETDTVTVEAVSASRRVPGEVVMRPDEAADAATGERWADQTQASWWTRLPIDRREDFTLVITIVSAEITRTVEVAVPARYGMVAEIVAEPVAGTLMLLGAASTLQVASATQDWARGPSPLSLAPTVRRFGIDTTIPTGHYVVSGDAGLDLADPEALTRPLAEREIDLGGVHALVRGWSPGSADVSITVRNPLPVAERGRRRQRMLLQEVREQAGPLRERAVAMCFGGSGSGDSVGPVVRELLRRGIGVDVCVSDHSVPVPEGATAVLLHSRAWHEALTHARYLVNNAEFPHYVRFREGQRYLQTWHGTPLKRIANDIVAPKLSAGYVAAMQREVGAWEALVAQNVFAGLVLPEAFGFERRTIVEGYPRNDALATDDGALRRRTRAALGLGTELAVLYAPTWRDEVRDAAGRRAFVSHLDAARLSAELGATVLVRSHSNAAAARGRIDAPGVIDVTAHPDITALMAAADVLVTDYSSVMFDFAVTQRPQVFLVPDVDEYRDGQRGFYLDLAQIAPGPVVTSTDEVIEALRDPGVGFESARAGFRQQFAGQDDGHAARRVVDAWLGPWSGDEPLVVAPVQQPEVIEDDWAGVDPVWESDPES